VAVITTKVQVWNLALYHIGASRTIDEGDGSKEEDACAYHWDNVRQTFLADANWPFAKRYVELTLVEETPNYDWVYSYRYPTSCLKVRRVVRPKLGRRDPIPPAYTVGNDDTGLLIVTDEPDAWCEITYDVSSIIWMSSLVKSALSWALAFELAPALSQINGIAKTCMEMYEVQRDRALEQALNETQIDLPSEFESEFIRARE